MCERTPGRTRDDCTMSMAMRQCMGTFVGVMTGALVAMAVLSSSHAPAHTQSYSSAHALAMARTTGGLRSGGDLAPASVNTAARGNASSGSIDNAAPAAPAPSYITSQAAVLRLYEPAGHEHLSIRDLNPAHTAILSAEAQAYIYASQHPVDCTLAKYIVSYGHTRGNGIGSIMHVSGSHLSAAVEMGRVFVWADKTGEEWTDEATCGTERNFLCHFKRPSHCTLEQALASEHIGAEMHYGVAGHPGSHVPSVFVRKLRAMNPAMKDDEIKYWWRGQSAAYLMRMNDATLAAVKEMRLRQSMHVVTGPAASSLQAFPFPPGTIHAHVRHGDKYTEMILQGTQKYFNASEELVREHPFSLRRFIFVSTEDRAVLDEALAYNETWSILYSDIPRSNTGPLNQLLDLGADRAGFTARTHLLQLLMSLETDAWVTTRGSNWNRVLDELRCIWVDKCKQSIVEVGTPESIEGYNW